MNLRKMTNAQIDKDDLKDLFMNGGLERDDELEIDGALWRVLRIENGKALIWKHTGLNQSSVFNENNSNVYEGSDLQKAMKALPVPEELQGLITENGFFPLSTEEIKELLPTEGERIATNEDGDTVWWWTRSAIRSDGSYAWSVSPSGGVDGYYYAANASVTLAPACAISVI